MFVANSVLASAYFADPPSPPHPANLPQHLARRLLQHGPRPRHINALHPARRGLEFAEEAGIKIRAQVGLAVPLVEQIDLRLLLRTPTDPGPSAGREPRG